jgi:hypothetical protein
MIAFLKMQLLFTDSQLDKLSDILIVIGEVLFASVVVPFFLGIDKVELPVIISALWLMTVSWVGSLLIVKGGKQ